ncbi:MAG TPA: nucleotide exchange factor GrpE [Acidobacteriota bacterium]|nr:nucleotide exchange factor GrpE [Acidobacteriota bacterium]
MKKKPAEPAAAAPPDAAESRGPAGTPSASAPNAAADPRDAEIERLRAREDELLRAVAEFQNINRRRKQESDATLRYAAEPILREILPVLDDLERALKAFPGADDPLRTGVALVQDRLLRVLEREGVEPIRPQDQPFDPDLHDAIAHLPVAGAAPGTVVEVAVPGYRYRDRVLRHAKVVVAADPGEAPGEPTVARAEDGGGV